jgi:hypothetical protein
MAPLVVALEVTITVAQSVSRALRHITGAGEISAVATIPVALLVEAAGVAVPVGNIGRGTRAGQPTAHVVCVIGALAAVEIALLAVALEVTITVADITSRTGTPVRRTAHVVCVLSAITVVEIARLVIASKITMTVAI